MKYVSLKNKNPSSFAVRGFSGGLDLGCPPCDIADNALCKCLNMRYDRGVLKTREGLLAESGDIIASVSPFSDGVTFYVTPGYFKIKGKYKKIAVATEIEDDAYYHCNIFFADADGNRTAAGSVTFNRISTEDFYQPVNMLFYSGKPVNGGGIFLLITKNNIYNTEEKSYSIFEISKDCTEWNEVQRFYEPIVYINGRGTRYEEARSTGLAFTGKPTLLEARNMLTDRFKAYFTSDGHSSCFRLPFTGLSSESVLCRVYVKPNEYADWLIQSNESSATRKFFTADITLNVDREKGTVYFTDSSGDYAVPMMGLYHENNICVTASKQNDEQDSVIFGAVCCDNIGGKTVFGSNIKGAEVFTVSDNNPLYFSSGSSVSLGVNGSIKSLLSLDGYIFAMCEREIIKLKLTAGSALNSNSLLADNDSVFYGSDKFTVSKFSESFGIRFGRTCRACGENIVWQDEKGNIYRISSKGGEPAVISRGAGAFAAEALSAFAECAGTKYILLCGGKAVIIDLEKSENVPVLLWDFGGITPVGIVCGGEKIRFFAVGSDGNVFYSAGLSGGSDVDFKYGSSAPVRSETKVKSLIETKHFSPGGMSVKKYIESVQLALSSGGRVDVSLNGGREKTLSLSLPDTDLSCGAQSLIEIIPHIGPVREAYITVSSQYGFSISEICFNYRTAL